MCLGISSLKTRSVKQTWTQTWLSPGVISTSQPSGTKDATLSGILDQIINLHTSPPFSSHLIHLSGASGFAMVSNKRLTGRPHLWLQTYLPRLCHSFSLWGSCIFQMECGSYVGQDRESKREAVKGTLVFVSARNHSNIDFQSHTWCFLWLDTWCYSSVR